MIESIKKFKRTGDLTNAATVLTIIASILNSYECEYEIVELESATIVDVYSMAIIAITESKLTIHEL